MNWRVLVGDARDRLGELEPGSVQTVVTSPPYFGLRDYGTGEWEGGAEGCDHRKPGATKTFGNPAFNENRPSREATDTVGYRDVCGRCGATRIDRQIGLEPSPDEFVEALVAVFRGVRRVLRDDGTVWLNLGDSYASSGPAGGAGKQHTNHGSVDVPVRTPPPGVKPKDLLGIPWLVAFALRADGWFLRSEIVWAKPNPMPESVTDRPTRSHEQVFLLSKSARYFYDADAIREETLWADDPRANQGHIDYNGKRDGAAGTGQRAFVSIDSRGRNKRSVWTVTTQPYAGAHFATFPPKLIEPCILAGSAERACGVCGAPWERVVRRTTATPGQNPGYNRDSGARNDGDRAGGWVDHESETLGFEPTCDHQDGSGSSVVLDPFAGAGTTGVVALRRDRSFVGIELNPEYAEMARNRIREDGPLFNVAAETVA